MGAISAKNDSRGRNEDGELTFLGRVLAHLPVDLHLGKMIVLGHIFGCLNECLIIGWSVTAMTPLIPMRCRTLHFLSRPNFFKNKDGAADVLAQQFLETRLLPLKYFVVCWHDWQ